MEKSLVMFGYLLLLGPDPIPVVKLRRDLVAIDPRITKYDVYHLLVLLRRVRLIGKSKTIGGHIVFLPPLFFALSYEYSRTLKRDPRDFIKASLRGRGIEWAFSDLMEFVKAYGDVISLFFGVVDSVYFRSGESFRAVALLYVASEAIPGPYPRLVPGIESGLLRKLELSKRAFQEILKLIKDRISALAPDCKNPVYINARSIASSAFLYILFSEGVKRILHYHYGKPDPHLSLLYSLNEKLADLYYNWEHHLGLGEQ